MSVAKIGGALTIALAAISSAALVILLAEPLHPLVIATGRVLVTAVALGLVGAAAVPRLVRAVRAEPVLAGRIVLAGALLGVHFGAWIASLYLTSVLRSVALVTTQPLFAGLLGRMIGDRASPGLYGGAAVALVGTVVLASPGASGDGSLAGDALALVGAVAAAGYFAVGRSVRARVDLGPYLAAVHLVAALGLALTVIAFGVPWLPAAAERSDLFALLWLGLVPGVVGHGLLNWAVRHVPVHSVALVVLLEPIGATALAVAVLARPVAAVEIAGAAIVLAGVALGLRARARAHPVD
jgi:drug/metabolite transporter (DMT)-like permease